MTSLRLGWVAAFVVALVASPSGLASQVGSVELGETTLESPSAGVIVESSEAYYTVPDTTLSDVIARLNSTRLVGAGGRMSQGLTEYHIQPEWTPAGRGGLCRVSNLTVHVRVRITLPTWPGETGRPVEERASWRTIEGAIREHEYEHRALTVEAAEALVARLGELETRGCRSLEQAFAGAVALADARLQEAHEQLDRETPARLSIGRREGRGR